MSVLVVEHVGDEAFVRDMAWVADVFGPEVRVDARPNLAAAGYEVTELHAREGSGCQIVVTVSDQDGVRLPMMLVARWWDTAYHEESGQILPNDLRSWRKVGVHGRTNGQGDIGWGMGGGDAYDPAGEELAVSENWVEGNSGRVHGLGWLAGTTHKHLDVVFRGVEGGGIVPPPPDPGVGDALCKARAAAQEAWRQNMIVVDELDKALDLLGIACIT